MKLTTVGELREFIKENGGEMDLGFVQFTHSDGKDIDVYIDGDLATWWSKDADPDVPLADKEVPTLSSSYKVEPDKLKKEIRELREENENLKSVGVDASVVLGKVEAYEKLLIGRTVTLGA